MCCSGDEGSAGMVECPFVAPRVKAGEGTGKFFKKILTVG